jgi:hypothetical protein
VEFYLSDREKLSFSVSKVLIFHPYETWTDHKMFALVAPWSTGGCKVYANYNWRLVVIARVVGISLLSVIVLAIASFATMVFD